MAAMASVDDPRRCGKYFEILQKAEKKPEFANVVYNVLSPTMISNGGNPYPAASVVWGKKTRLILPGHIETRLG